MADSKLFINRKQELNFLKKDIGAERSVSRLLFVSATTGIGKSALVDQAMQSLRIENFRVSIHIEKANDIQDGYLLKQLTKVVHQASVNNVNIRNIYEFIRADRFYRNVANGLIKVIKKYVQLDDFLDGFNSENKKKKEELQSWLGDDKELIDICYKYLLSVSEVVKLYFAIENIQIVDQRSLRCLKDILCVRDNVYIIGEFTISNDYPDISEQLEIFIDDAIEVNNLHLEKIDKRELINSIKDEKDLLIGIIERTYENSDGNLHKFKLLRNSNHIRNYDINISTYNNVTKSLINNLDDTSLLILTSIQAHRGTVSRNLLIFFLQHAPSFQFASDNSYTDKFLSLKELGLIDLQANQVSLKHDSISLDLIDIPKIQRLLIIVIRDWIRIYQLTERNFTLYDIDYVDNLLWQIHFMLKISAFDEIAGVLAKLSRFISISPAYNIVFQLDKIAEAYKKYVTDESNVEVFKWLIITYYQCGYADKVVNLCSPYLLTDTTILLCFLAALSTIDNNEVFIQLAEIDDNRNQILKMGLQLVRIRALRSSDRLQEALDLWNKHYHDRTFKDSFFEAGFLKYSSLVIHDDYDFRVNALKRAAVLFEQNNDSYGRISTSVTLSRDYAYLGDLTECKRYLTLAENLSNTIIYPRYQLYNNRGVLDIISKTITQITKDCLNNALRICSNSGDRLIIQSNLLVIAVIEKDILYGFPTYNRLKKHALDHFDAEDTILQICIYNCYQYALMAEEAEDIPELLTLLYRTVIKQDHDLWNFLLYDNGVNKYPHVICKDYYPTFMIGWDLDYYNVLSNYQQANEVRQ